MNTLEKIFSIFAIIFAVSFLILIFTVPQLQQLSILLPLTGVALVINIGLMFVIFKDIYFRTFSNPNQKFVWFALILFLWPSVVFYLVLYGFKPRG